MSGTLYYTCIYVYFIRHSPFLFQSPHFFLSLSFDYSLLCLLCKSNENELNTKKNTSLVINNDACKRFDGKSTILAKYANASHMSGRFEWQQYNNETNKRKKKKKHYVHQPPRQKEKNPIAKTNAQQFFFFELFFSGSVSFYINEYLPHIFIISAKKKIKRDKKKYNIFIKITHMPVCEKRRSRKINKFYGYLLGCMK